MYLDVAFGDGNQEAALIGGDDTGTVTHTYTQSGTYCVRALVIPDGGSPGDFTPCTYVEILPRSPKVTEYTDVTYPCGSLDTVCYEVGAVVEFDGETYDGVVRGSQDADLLPLTLPATYSGGYSEGDDDDEDEVPSSIFLKRQNCVITTAGKLQCSSAPEHQVDIDPDDADPCTPRPQIVHSGPTISRDPVTGDLTVGASITACHAGGTTGHTVNEGLPGPFPQRLDGVPTGNHRTEDADGDSVPVVYAEFATLVVQADGSHDFEAGSQYEQQLGGDPDDADPTFPAPTHDGPHADIAADGPDCDGADAIYIERLGGTITFRGDTYGEVLSDSCVSADVLPVAVTFPTNVREGDDADGDGIAADYTLEQSTLVVEKDGTITGPAPGPDGDTLPGDPDDTDPFTPTATATLSARVGCEADTVCADAGVSGRGAGEQIEMSESIRAELGPTLDAFEAATGYRPARLGPDSATVYAPPTDIAANGPAISVGPSLQVLTIGGWSAQAACDDPASASWDGLTWSGVLNGNAGGTSYTEPGLATGHRCTVFSFLPSDGLTVTDLPSVEEDASLP